MIAGGVLPAARSYTHPVRAAGGARRQGAVPRQRDELDDVPQPARSVPRRVREITAKRQKTFEYLLDTTDWDFAVLVYVSTDRIQHCLMEYVAPEHPKYDEVKDTSGRQAKTRGVYQQLDDGLAELLERTNDDDLVIFMSDHGHQPCTRTCTMDRILANLGFLEFGKGSPWPST